MSGALRVALVTPKTNLETGGGSHYSLLLYAAGLQRLDAEVDVYSLNTVAPASGEMFGRAGVPLHDLGGLSEIVQLERLGDTKADVVFFDTNLPASYRFKRRFPHRRVGVHISTLSGFCTAVGRQQAGCWLRCSHLDRVRHHAGGLARRAKYVFTGRRRVRDLASGFRSLDGCVFPSPQTVEAYAIYGLDPARCFVVPECLDIPALRRYRAAEFGSSGGPLTLLYIGLLAEYKGMSLLFDALRRLRIPWRLRIYGDGPDRGRVQAFAAEHGGRVDFRGYVPNAAIFPELVGGDFLFVHPCLWFEALGRAILEAMAVRIPVLVPDVGGPAWSVTDGLNGLHYAHRDAADLARRIEWAHGNPAAVRALVATASEDVVRYDARSVAAQWRATLGRIAGRGDADA
jgi:glycosyltransferase involved in cell wall biosynthesis